MFREGGGTIQPLGSNEIGSTLLARVVVGAHTNACDAADPTCEIGAGIAGQRQPEEKHDTCRALEGEAVPFDAGPSSIGRAGERRWFTVPDAATCCRAGNNDERNRHSCRRLARRLDSKRGRSMSAEGVKATSNGTRIDYEPDLEAGPCCRPSGLPRGHRYRAQRCGRLGQWLPRVE